MKAIVSRVHFPITALGPGRRLGLWFQGCSIRCPGCISRDTWEAEAAGGVELDELYRIFAAHAGEADGLTVSGGEPFDQPEPLAALLAYWRSVSDRPTLVFTGREFGEVSIWLRCNPGLIDSVITGPFLSDRPQTLALRGSDNQSLHVLTERGRDMLQFERAACPADRKLDVMFDQDGNAWMAGIPARGDIARLWRALAAAGHSASTSADRDAA